MAWVTPLTAVSSTALTAAQWNASVRDNLLETGPAKATTSGGYLAVGAANTLVERVTSSAVVTTSETTTSTTYTDLATVGPAVTATASAKAVVLWSARMSNNIANAGCLVGIDLTGATTITPTDAAALAHTSATANAVQGCSYAHVFSVGSGSTTYTLKYRNDTGATTGTFLSRRIHVLPY